MRKILVIVILILSFSCNETRKDDVKTGKLTLQSISSNLIHLNGQPFNVSITKGKRVLINYWATWCKPCKKEMPDLIEAQKKLKKENYIFLLVSDEDIDLISEFNSKTNYDFIFFKSTKSISSLGIYALPTTFVFNKKGKAVDKIIGTAAWNSEKMITQLKNIK
mgnify:CR=1 FL=1